MSRVGLPCDVCSSGRQWQCAGAELVVGDAAGHTAVGEVARGMGLVEEAPGSTRWGQGDGMAVDTEDVGGKPCRVGAPVDVVVVEGGCCSSG
jgi:hypothetical protein